MIPWVLLVVTVVFHLYTGWLPYTLHVPLVPGLFVASLVAAWAMLRWRRPHATLGFPLLAVPTALLLFTPLDVSVTPKAKLGVRVVPVVYGLLTEDGLEAVRNGEIESRGCIVPANPKRWPLQIGYRLSGLEEWGRGVERVLRVQEVTARSGP